MIGGYLGEAPDPAYLVLRLPGFYKELICLMKIKMIHFFLKETVKSEIKNDEKNMIFSRCFGGLRHRIEERAHGSNNLQNKRKIFSFCHQNGYIIFIIFDLSLVFFEGP